MNIRLAYLFILFYFFTTQTVEFLYPVGVDSHRSLVYLLYQKNPTHIELWGWDYKTKRANQMLFSRFTPAGFRMLPGGDGFSFIDNGLLKIQQFLKRSPRTVEFDAPIYNVEVVHWVDAKLCYTSGKYVDHFGIFAIDYDGAISPLCLSDSSDCMYPQKVDADLFYIERDSQWQYRVMRTDYILPPSYETFQERRAWNESHVLPSERILDFGNNPIIFLSMVSSNEGFMIGHSPTISNRDSLVQFEYYHITKQDDTWNSETLFSFEIPSKFLVLGHRSRLYEALLPLLPQHDADRITYVDSVNGDLGLFVYDRKTKTREILFHEENHSRFASIRVEARVFCGGKIGAGIGMEACDVGGEVELQEIPHTP